MNKTFQAGKILIPNKNIDYSKWATVACDQFSSQLDYWQEVAKIVGEEPSTLYLMLPEVYLDTVDIEETRKNINGKMNEYVESGIFEELDDSLIYIERTLDNGKIRPGLVGLLNLEKYDFNKDSTSAVKASENTIISRLPPRITMREDAIIEMPHVMVLIDDQEDSVMGPLRKNKDQLEKIYDFELMQKGGSIAGYKITGQQAREVEDRVEALADLESFEEKYNVSGKSVTQMIIGDGNHSLAAAKACWEKIKTSLSEEEAKNHPAQYALIELSNVHDESLEIEPIHRAIFNVDIDKLTSELLKECPHINKEPGDYKMVYQSIKGSETIYSHDLTLGQTINEVQVFLDDYVEKNGGSIDYIHGDDVLSDLSSKENTLGIYMPPVEKGDLFKSVINGGVFPKKSFSMGNAIDKRYYFECRKIK